MPVSQLELGGRLRLAREAAGLTQDEVGEKIDVPRSGVAQIELGKRSVSSLELDGLARLYGRDIREFLADEFVDTDVLVALFRANADLEADPSTIEALRECMSTGREFTELERRVGLDRDVATAVCYQILQPKTRWEAIRQGATVAEHERRRLGIGDAAISDLPELLEAQGVRTAPLLLPQDISGLTLIDADVGPFVVTNASEPAVRQTFSYAHEYAHVLLDRDARGMISRDSDRSNLTEMRANSFAASFLMPETGVRQFLSNLGKGIEARLFAEAPTNDDDAISIEARGSASLHDVQLHDVVLLSHHFSVSRRMALYRLRNLKILGDRRFQELMNQDQAGKGRQLARVLNLPLLESADTKDRFRQRFLTLALEAYRRETITRDKLAELASIWLTDDDVTWLLDQFARVPTDENVAGAEPAA